MIGRMCGRVRAHLRTIEGFFAEQGDPVWRCGFQMFGRLMFASRLACQCVCVSMYSSARWQHTHLHIQATCHYAMASMIRLEKCTIFLQYSHVFSQKSLNKSLHAHKRKGGTKGCRINNSRLCHVLDLFWERALSLQGIHTCIHDMCIIVCICKYIQIYTCIYIYICRNIHVCVHVYIYIHMYTSTSISI